MDLGGIMPFLADYARASAMNRQRDEEKRRQQEEMNFKQQQFQQQRDMQTAMRRDKLREGRRDDMRDKVDRSRQLEEIMMQLGMGDQLKNRFTKGAQAATGLFGKSVSPEAAARGAESNPIIAIANEIKQQKAQASQPSTMDTLKEQLARQQIETGNERLNQMRQPEQPKPRAALGFEDSMLLFSEIEQLTQQLTAATDPRQKQEIIEKINYFKKMLGMPGLEMPQQPGLKLDDMSQNKPTDWGVDINKMMQSAPAVSTGVRKRY